MQTGAKPSSFRSTYGIEKGGVLSEYLFVHEYFARSRYARFSVRSYEVSRRIFWIHAEEEQKRDITGLRSHGPSTLGNAQITLDCVWAQACTLSTPHITRARRPVTPKPFHHWYRQWPGSVPSSCDPRLLLTDSHVPTTPVSSR